MRQQQRGRVRPSIDVSGRGAKEKHGGGFGLLSILAWPIMAPYKVVAGVAGAVKEELDDELYNPERVRKELTDLQLMHDMGEIEQEEFESRADALLARLNEIRELEQEQQAA